MALKITGDTAIQLSDYVAVLARRKLVLLIAVLLGAAAAVGYSYGIATPAYVSQASVLVRPVLDRPFNPGTGGIDKAVNMGTEKTVATSNAVAQIVKDTLKLPDDVTTVASRASAQTVGTTQLLQIAYTDKTKASAQRGAQAFAEAYLRFKADLASKSRDDIRNNVVKPLQALDDQINALRVDIAGAGGTPWPRSAPTTPPPARPTGSCGPRSWPRRHGAGCRPCWWPARPAPTAGAAWWPPTWPCRWPRSASGSCSCRPTCTTPRP